MGSLTSQSIRSVLATDRKYLVYKGTSLEDVMAIPPGTSTYYFRAFADSTCTYTFHATCLTQDPQSTVRRQHKIGIVSDGPDVLAWSRFLHSRGYDTILPVRVETWKTVLTKTVETCSPGDSLAVILCFDIDTDEDVVRIIHELRDVTCLVFVQSCTSAAYLQRLASDTTCIVASVSRTPTWNRDWTIAFLHETLLRHDCVSLNQAFALSLGSYDFTDFPIKIGNGKLFF